MTQLACFTSFLPKPTTIDSLCYSESHGVIGEGLSDGSIRLLDSKTLAATGAIAGDHLRSVRRMLFYRDTILSCGVHGVVSMWDLKTLVEVCSLESSQGAIWDMVLDGDRLFLATETGAVVVVALTEASMSISSFWRSAPTKSSAGSSIRALSICSEGDFVFVADANGSISRWVKKTGQCDSTFSLPAKGSSPTLVWSLVSVGKDRIASGDSLGTLSVWDSVSCTLMQARQDHQADILTMHRCGSLLLTAGVDSRVARYSINEESVDFVSISTMVARDVSAITTTDCLLLAGGSDGRLGVASVNMPADFSAVKLGRFAHVSSLVRNDLVFCQTGPETIAVYKIAGLGASNEFVAELDNKRSISSFTVDPSGQRIAISSVDSTRVLSMGTCISEQLRIPFASASCSVLSEQWLVLANSAGQLGMCELSTGKVRQMLLPGLARPHALRIVQETCLLAIDCSGNVFRMNLLKKRKQEEGGLVLSLGALVTAVSELSGDFMHIATADNKVHSVRLDSAVTLAWTKSIPKSVQSLPFQAIRHIEQAGSTLLLISEYFILSLTEAGQFKLHPSSAMGGLILGSGRTRDGHVLVMLAQFKAVQAQLTAQFECKTFQI